jgi:GT2 family glycosyltransferase
LYRLLCGQTSLLPFPFRDLNEQYRTWQQHHQLTPEILASKCEAVERMAYRPLISLVLLVDQGNERCLRKTTESVQFQAYPQWELCVICDQSVQDSVARVVDSYAVVDVRVRFNVFPAIEAADGFGRSILQFVSGEFLCFLASDVELAPDALLAVVEQLNQMPDLDLLYFDEDVIGENGESVAPFFKPGWSPDLLLAMNYVGRICVLRTKVLLGIAESWGDIYKGDIYHLILRFTEETDKILRIPRVLYHLQPPALSVAMSFNGKRASDENGVWAIQEALSRRGEQGEVACIGSGRYRVDFRVRGTPLVSIIIPTRDRGALLKQCIESIEGKTRYARYEILVLDNGSADPRTLRYLDTVAEKWCVHRCPGPFNYSSINNAGAAQAKGEYVLFLNNDIEVISPDWLTAMVAQAQRSGVGAVGAKLLYPDGSIQHAGVVLGVDGIAGHAFRHTPAGAGTYHAFADVARNCSAVTAACMLVPREVFRMINGFDEQLRVELNDVDLCLRIQERGYRVVYAPDAVLYHYENATRKGRRSPSDEALFQRKWGDLITKGDPHYNPNLTRRREDWGLDV